MQRKDEHTRGWEASTFRYSFSKLHLPFLEGITSPCNSLDWSSLAALIPILLHMLLPCTYKLLGEMLLEKIPWIVVAQWNFSHGIFNFVGWFIYSFIVSRFLLFSISQNQEDNQIRKKKCIHYRLREWRRFVETGGRRRRTWNWGFDREVPVLLHVIIETR